jgi:hypothetical protein
MFDRVINFLVSSLLGNLVIQQPRQRNPTVDFCKNHLPINTGLKRNLVTGPDPEQPAVRLWGCFLAFRGDFTGMHSIASRHP